MINAMIKGEAFQTKRNRIPSERYQSKVQRVKHCREASINPYLACFALSLINHSRLNVFIRVVVLLTSSRHYRCGIWSPQYGKGPVWRSGKQNVGCLKIILYN